MAVLSSRGGTLHFNTSLPTAEDASSYGALSTWKQLENVVDVPPLKETSGDVTFTPLETGWTVHVPGVLDMESTDVTAAFDESDSTNLELLRGYNNGNTVLAFKYVNSAGRTWYWKGRVANFGPTADSAEAYDGREFQLRNAGQALIEVAPS